MANNNIVFKSFVWLCLVAVSFSVILGVVVWGVQLFVAPRKMHISPDKEYEAVVRKNLDSLQQANSYEIAEKQFAKVAEMLSFFLKSQCIDSALHKELQDDFMETYIPVFNSSVHKKMQQSVLSKADLQQLQCRVAVIKSICPGTMEQVELCNSVSEFIYTYILADSLLGETRFTTENRLRQRINDRNSLLSDVELCKCYGMESRLKEYPKVLGEKHYEAVQKKIAETDSAIMSSRNCEEFYKCYIEPTRYSIREYQSVEKTFYGKSEKETLWRLYDGVYDKACKHFRKLGQGCLGN